MKKEKNFHATLLENGDYLCRVQFNKERRGFREATEEEAIRKASEWYYSQVKEKENNISVERIEEPSINNNAICKYLKDISEHLTIIINNKNNDSFEDRYLTVKDMADYLKISEGQAYNIIHQPDFPRQKIGRDYRISFLELKDYLKRHRFNQIKV